MFRRVIENLGIRTPLTAQAEQGVGDCIENVANDVIDAHELCWTTKRAVVTAPFAGDLQDDARQE